MKEQLSRHYIAEILPNVTLNHNQPINQPMREYVMHIASAVLLESWTG